MKFAAAMVLLLVAVAAATFWFTTSVGTAKQAMDGLRLVKVVVLAVVIGTIVLGALRRRALEKAIAAALPRERTVRGEPDYPGSFGIGCAWLAVRGASPAQLAAALDLQDVVTAGWSEGLDAMASEPSACIVGGPIDGWTIAVGDGLAIDVAEARGWLDGLAQQFAEVQAFTTQHVVELHAWARYRDGQLVRRFAWLGETGEVIADDGAPTVEERQLERVFARATAATFERVPDENDVTAIAGAWSLDPTRLGERGLPKSTVLLGMLAR